MKAHNLLLSFGLILILSFFIFCFAKANENSRKHIKQTETILIERQKKIKKKLDRIEKKLSKIKNNE